mmetsp:Transcript_17679/g.30037  ORF Transcript_17679/g.30037 Transcript_17679/m.30037 type:complete len:106 (+) Transcript_17679:197-514(+)
MIGLFQWDQGVGRVKLTQEETVENYVQAIWTATAANGVGVFILTTANTNLWSTVTTLDSLQGVTVVGVASSWQESCAVPPVFTTMIVINRQGSIALPSTLISASV